jgi:hypothetical protein
LKSSLRGSASTRSTQARPGYGKARLRTAEDLEHRAANIRARLALDSRLLVVGADQQPRQIFTSATPRVSKGPTADLWKRKAQSGYTSPASRGSRRVLGTRRLETNKFQRVEEDRSWKINFSAPSVSCPKSHAPRASHRSFARATASRCVRAWRVAATGSVAA